MSLLAGIKEITSGDIKVQEPMKNHTSLRIGGPADFLVIPQSISETRELLLFCRKEFIPLFVFGGGTNLLVSDKGIRGIAVKMEKPFRGISFDGSEVTVGAGLPLPLLASYVGQEGLSGLEFAAGIPGTVGGA
ncbi:MAG: UDP-N-acetylenolpyruvoylglucosamine reductase, partial [Firmicutes bacterium HGW-Firmicutes-13]